MANIELPTYRTILPNCVYGKKAEPLYHRNGGRVSATEVAKLSRYKIPLRDRVIDFIRTSAENIEPCFLGKGEPLRTDSETVSFLKFLPKQYVKDLIKGDKNILEHLKVHYPKSNLQEARHYIEVFNGVVPNEFLDEVRKLRDRERSIAYERAIERVGVGEWNLKVRLLENSSFPDRLELEYLLNKGVRDCDIFSVCGDCEDYKDVANKLRLLYNILNSPELISQIEDSSCQFLEQRADSTVRGTVECITTKKISEGLMGIVGGLIGSLGNLSSQNSKQDREKDKSRFNYPGDCGFSLN